MAIEIELKDLEGYLLKDIAKVKKRFAVALDQRLTNRTRVKTGVARANWTFTDNGFDQRFIQRIGQNKARGKARSSEALRVTRLVHNDVYIANNAPYIEFLNDLDNFVDLSIIEAKQKVFG